jgi:dihydrofolate reductase
MAKLIYCAITSLDGYVSDAGGSWDWSYPDEEVHTFVNELVRPVGTSLLGRRMYEVLVAWETMDVDGEPQAMRDYAAMWLESDKIVYSTTLAEPSSARTRIERRFDAEAVRQLKATADRDLSIGGPELAAHALRAGLVDELHLIISPAIVGGGQASLPDDLRLQLELLGERRFANGVVHLHYDVLGVLANS